MTDKTEEAAFDKAWDASGLPESAVDVFMAGWNAAHVRLADDACVERGQWRLDGPAVNVHGNIVGYFIALENGTRVGQSFVNCAFDAAAALANAERMVQQAASGCRLIPEEPTDEMLAAGAMAAADYGSPYTRTANAWRAMLNAAPTPPVAARAERSPNAAMFAELEAELRRPVQGNGDHGYWPDRLHIAAADAIRDLRVALDSQIEITNTERARADALVAAPVVQQRDFGAGTDKQPPIQLTPKERAQIDADWAEAASRIGSAPRERSPWVPMSEREPPWDYENGKQFAMAFWFNGRWTLDTATHKNYASVCKYTHWCELSALGLNDALADAEQMGRRSEGPEA